MKQSSKSGPRAFARWAFGVALAVTAGSASALAIYEQGPATTNARAANVTDPGQAADGFALGLAASLDSITWWGSYAGGFDAGDDSFQVRLYSAMSGTGSLLDPSPIPGAVTRYTTSLLLGGVDEVYRYRFDLTGFKSLAAGAYYLSVQNQGSANWLWLDSAAGNDGLWLRLEDADEWQEKRGDLAFILSGTVRTTLPEPGSLALLLLAGASLGLARRREGYRQ